MDNEDKVKQILGKSAEEIFAAKNTNSHKVHGHGAFCGNAEPQELEHIQRLIDDLNDNELVLLIDAVGIQFGAPTNEIEREMLESVVDEADREQFYKEYHAIIDSRK